MRCAGYGPAVEAVGGANEWFGDLPILKYGTSLSEFKWGGVWVSQTVLLKVVHPI